MCPHTAAGIIGFVAEVSLAALAEHVWHRSDGAVDHRVVIASTASVGAGVVFLSAAAPYWTGRPLPWVDVAVHVSVAASFIGAGLIAWWRRPANRTGMLMTAVGFLWLVGDLGFVQHPLPATIALTYQTAYQVVLGHLALAYPTGRLQSRGERRVVRVAYAWTLLNNPIWMTVYDPQAECASCPENLLFIGHNPGVEGFLDVFTFVVSLGLMLLIGVLIARRWRVSSATRRRVMAPAIWGVGPAMVALVGSQVANLTDLGPEAARIVYNFLPLGLTVLPIGLLVGVLRIRMSYVSVGRLVRDLSSDALVDLRAALATALHDPTLELYYWTERGYIDPDGASAVVHSAQGRLVRPIDVAGRQLAVLVLDESVAEEADLVDAVVAAAQLVLENARLGAEVRAQLVELRSAAARMVSAGEQERRRIERDLHDGAQQRLLALSLALARERQHEEGHVAEVLDRAGTELQVAITELRELARGIHPVLLTQEGLRSALQAIAERAGLPVEVSCPRTRLPGPVEATAYFIATEAVSNALRHASASRIRIDVTVADAHMRMTASDDGVGGADPAGGTGLRGLSDRVAALGGHFSVTSNTSGTTIMASLPCA